MIWHVRGFGRRVGAGGEGGREGVEVRLRGEVREMVGGMVGDADGCGVMQHADGGRADGLPMEGA